MVVTHDISTAKRVSDYIGTLYRRNLVQFGPAHEMFESDIPVARQFLAGDTEGPIGMSEEKDQTKSAEQDAKDMGRDTDEDTSDDTRPRSRSGMTAQEDEDIERAAGAPEEEPQRS